MAQHANHKPHSRPLYMAAILTAAMSMPQGADAGISFEDEFTGSSLGAEWNLNLGNDPEGATTVVTNGGLNLNTPVVTGARPGVEYNLDGAGAPVVTAGADWTYEAAISLGMASDFDVTAAGEGIGITILARDSAINTDHKAQINAVGLNFGGGFGHAVRGAGTTDGNTDPEAILQLGNGAAPIDMTLRMAYEASSKTFEFGIDTGAGFVGLTDPFDITSWGMAGTDTFDLRLELSYVGFTQDNATSTFSVETGEVVVDRVTIYDEALEVPAPVPEPSSFSLLALGALGLAIRRRR